MTQHRLVLKRQGVEAIMNIVQRTPHDRKPADAHRKIGDGVERLPDWTGECVAIIASGPSAKALQPQIQTLRNRMHVLVINNCWELAPWADMLYACDIGWWQLYRGAPGFEGLRVTQDIMACTMFPQHQLIRIEVGGGEDLMFKRFGEVATGGNGGFQMLNLAAQMGATGIALIGFDMTGEHWHGRHGPPCTNPDESNFRNWRAAFDKVAPTLAARGIDVVNCSVHTSTITAYPKITIAQMLERWGL